MTELERELTREHCRRWRRNRKSLGEILAGLFTIAALVLLIASLAHADPTYDPTKPPWQQNYGGSGSTPPATDKTSTWTPPAGDKPIETQPALALVVKSPEIKLANRDGVIGVTKVTRDDDVEVVGTIANTTTQHLTSVSLKMTIKDCSWFSSQCTIVAQESNSARVDIPPGQTRAVPTGTFRFNGLPEYSWSSWRVLDVSVADADSVELENARADARYRQELADQRREKEAEQQRQAEEQQRQAAEQQRQAEERQHQEEVREAAIANQRAALQAEADRKAEALREAVIDPSLLSIEFTFGTVYGGEAMRKWNPMWPGISGRVVNHSNQTLRAMEIELQASDCSGCYVTKDWDEKISVEVPPGQQRSFGSEWSRIGSDAQERDTKYPAHPLPAQKVADQRSSKASSGMIGDCGEEDAEDDRDGPVEPGGEDHGEDLRLIADLSETDDHRRDEEGFHGTMPFGVRRETDLGTAPPPDPVQGTDVKGLAKPCRAVPAMAGAKCVDANPAIDAGGYSPMDNLFYQMRLPRQWRSDAGSGVSGPLRWRCRGH